MKKTSLSNSMIRQMAVSKYKWIILVLATFTNAIVVAVPSISMSVLLPDISEELGLSLVQAGLVWGISSFPVIFMGLLGGAYGDRFGPKRLLILSCAVVGITGALRGMATDFVTLAAISVLFGLMTSVITMNNLKVAGSWFAGKELGLASGFLSAGMAMGFLVGSTIGNTLLSTWLGSWRNVFYFLGAISLMFVILWSFYHPSPDETQYLKANSEKTSIRANILHVAKIPNLWLLGFSALAANGAVQGLLGYAPLDLDRLGWSDLQSAQAIGLFTFSSLAFVIPISLWSDRRGSRKGLMITSLTSMIAGLVMMATVHSELTWLGLLFAGVFRDGYMAVMLATAIETEGVGAQYSGSATGFVMVFIGLGNLLAPPIGNSTASLHRGMPYLSWALLAVMGIISIFFLKIQRKIW